MTEDLDSKTREELQDIIAEARRRIAAAERAMATLVARRKAEARKAAEAAARQFGFELGEVLADPPPAGRGGRSRKAQGEARYRNPENPRETWAGRGRKPNWIKKALAEGRDLADFAA